MAVTIDYDKLQSGNRITWTWTPAGGITDVEDAVISELNAGYNISSAVAFDGTDFSNQASETNNEPSFADEGNVQTRGASLGAGLGGGAEVNTTRRGSEKTIFQLTIVLIVVFSISLIIGIVS